MQTNSDKVSYRSS